MLEYQAAEDLFMESSHSTEESLQAEPQPSYHQLSDEKTDTEQQQEAVAKCSAALQHGPIGLSLESKFSTSSQSSTGPVSPPLNAVTSSLELLGPHSSDISPILKENHDCSPAQHEDDSSVIDGDFADSTGKNGGEVALPPGEYHITSAGDGSKVMETDTFCQFEAGNLPGLTDAHTDKNNIVNEISKVVGSHHLILNGQHLDSHVQVVDSHHLKLNGQHLDSHVQVHMPMIALESAGSTEHFKRLGENRGLVDTTAPFESVREAVSKFGGIVDWKAHKTLTIEKRKHAHVELEKIQEVIPTFRKDSEAAEVAKAEVLKELDNTKRIVDLLKLNLEKAQIEEAQAKQDAQLAQLRAKEIEDGIADEASIASKAQLEVAKARHEAAVAELKSVQEELKTLQEQYTSSVGESDIAMRRAEDAFSTSKEIEKEVEGLTLELITAKESLESAYAAHLEAEEHRMSAALARDEDCLSWDKEIKQAQQELYRLGEQFLQTRDLKEKLIGASSLLSDLKKELAAHMESQLKEQSQSIEEDETKDDLDESKGFQLALASGKKELEDVKANVEMAKNEVSILRVAQSSLKSEFERQKVELASSRQREEMALIAVSSLEAEIERTIEEIKQVIVREKESREKMVELPELLQQAALEADKSKSSAKTAREDQKKVIEEVEQVKSTLSTTKIRLTATLKEIEAAGASERLALAASKALQESEDAAALGESPRGVTLPLEEYYTLSKKAHEAEEFANERITAATAQIQVAKVSELNSLQRLKEAYREMDRRKEELRIATEKANKAKEGKLGVEQELRKWRAELEQRRRESSVSLSASNPPGSPERNFSDSLETKTESIAAVSVAADVIHPTPGPKIYISGDKMEHGAPEFKPRKKSFFPHMVMFLAKKRAQSRK